MAEKYPHRNFRDESFESIALALGQVALAWNDLHLSLSGLFGTVVHIGNGVMSGAIWNSLHSDKAQRDMLQAAITTNALGYELKNKTREEILWVLNRSQKLANDRNNALHVPLVRAAEGEVVSFFGLGNQRALNLKDNNLERLFSCVYEDIMILSGYVDGIEESIRRPQIDFPIRPRLTNRADVKK